jgi:hypothetical protein
MKKEGGGLVRVERSFLRASLTAVLVLLASWVVLSAAVPWLVAGTDATVLSDSELRARYYALPWHRPAAYAVILLVCGLAAFRAARLRPSSWLGLAAVPATLVLLIGIALFIRSNRSALDPSLLVLPVAASAAGAWLARSRAA